MLQQWIIIKTTTEEVHNNMPLYTLDQINEIISSKKEEYKRMKLAGDLSGKTIQDFLSKDLHYLYLLRKQLETQKEETSDDNT
jgi:predicted nucleotidyltransferase